MGGGDARVQERAAHRPEQRGRPLRARAGAPRREGREARLLGARGDGSPRPEQLRRPPAQRRAAAVRQARGARARARARRRDPRGRAHALGGVAAPRARPHCARPGGRGGQRLRGGGEGGSRPARAPAAVGQPPARRRPRGRGGGRLPQAHRDPPHLPELGGAGRVPGRRAARRRGRGGLSQGHHPREARGAHRRHLGAGELPDGEGALRGSGAGAARRARGRSAEPRVDLRAGALLSRRGPHGRGRSHDRGGGARESPVRSKRPTARSRWRPTTCSRSCAVPRC